MRTYERTHPWLSFQLNLKALPPELWLLLGEARSKCEHLAGVPLRPDTAERLHRVYLAKGALATTAIEGNTLSAQQVEQHLEGKLHLPPSKKYLQVEVDNVIGACNAICDAVRARQSIALTPELILSFNRDLLKGLAVPHDVAPGVIRSHPVGVQGYRGAPAEDCEYLIQRLTTWLQQLQDDAPLWMAHTMPIVRAMLAHLYLAWIHPFGDGNGRTARLVEFAILIAAGIPSPAAHLLSNHYNETRSEYYRQLALTSKSGGDLVPFLLYAAQGFIDGLVEQVGKVKEQQLDVTWRNYVHEMFRNGGSEAHSRQKHLVLDLSMKSEPVRDLREVSTRLATAYAARTSKTLSRDLNAVIKKGLVVETPQGFRAKKEIIEAFLAVKAPAALPVSGAPSARASARVAVAPEEPEG